MAAYLRDWTLLVASFLVGLTFAWKKIPTDTMVQESLPDGYRGRTFAIFDVSYNAARIAAAGVAIAMVPAFGTRWSVALVGAIFVAWTPVLPRWLRGKHPIDVVFAPGGAPRTVRWGGARGGGRGPAHRDGGPRRRAVAPAASAPARRLGAGPRAARARRGVAIERERDDPQTADPTYVILPTMRAARQIPASSVSSSG